MENSRRRHLPQHHERIDWGVLGFLTFAHILAIVGLFHFSWRSFAAFAVLYVVSGVGITFGFHRLFSHRSFKVPKWIEYVAAVAGTLALQGSLMKWVAHHRLHHAFSDKEKDPHDSNRGFWFSHILWTFYSDKSLERLKFRRKFSRDIAADPVLVFLSTNFFVVASQLTLAAGLWIFGGWEMMLWGIWVRVVAVYHATWFVNSAAHKWGYRNYEAQDSAKNCWWVGLVTFGEGWHNNHHAYANVAPAGHRWWEIDVTWMLIKTLRFFRLATDVNVPPARSESRAVRN